MFTVGVACQSIQARRIQATNRESMQHCSLRTEMVSRDKQTGAIEDSPYLPTCSIAETTTPMKKTRLPMKREARLGATYSLNSIVDMYRSS
jgi:hypothetical protein